MNQVMKNKELAFEVEGITVKFGKFVAVNSVTFQVVRGEIFGFLGANGAGKTTTIRVLCGLLPSTSGTAKIGGIDVTKNPRGVKSQVGYMSQKFTLYEDMTVEENLSFTASLRKLDRIYFKNRMKELFDLIGFSWTEDTLVRNLPPGVMQQVALASAVLHDPQIVFLDEPTAGVTPAFRAKFWKLIRKLAEMGKTVFVTTHYMDEAEECERIALMRAGEIIAIDSPSNLKRKTFPEPIFEITPPEVPPSEWLKNLRRQKFISTLEPYGMRYHAVVKEIKQWDVYRKDSLNAFTIEPVEPSLEDVFIRLVEGENR